MSLAWQIPLPDGASFNVVCSTSLLLPRETQRLQSVRGTFTPPDRHLFPRSPRPSDLPHPPLKAMENLSASLNWNTRERYLERMELDSEICRSVTMTNKLYSSTHDSRTKPRGSSAIPNRRRAPTNTPVLLNMGVRGIRLAGRPIPPTHELLE
ncbi:hypothetical protein GMRT_10730 [Giardia muris]|uniref:Uncharacterized protein n=1 Tax=Giardia muris TaxID=5742 RepID=A0A4Z1SY51_GIAMU|nr:hypothetical protein GMRT_10730 [Giardia muris]|eukprot:TNJ30682.1 hypothetical protein GMRT_10730 [Giardia muris]